MSFRSLVCSPLSASTWFAAGVAFLAVGIQQPAFIGLGAACLALSVRAPRNNGNRAS